jgi:Rab3 GTPase-activating protein catalytic subunit
MQHCIAYQKLEMINCCIRKQHARNELLRMRKTGAKKASVTQAADTDSDDEFHSADEDSGEATPTSGDEDDADFYLAPEHEESLLQHGDDAVHPAPQSGSDSSTPGPTRSSDEDESEGVASISPKLHLLGTSTPLRIPVTQNEGPMTEDMMELKLSHMTEMGTSKKAVEERAQLQSMSLRSDMSAFKAANPQCCLEDFVRWHSPRDYIEKDDGSGQLSERMCEPDNIWQQLWRDSEPRPVARQRTLFDCTKEALIAIKSVAVHAPRHSTYFISYFILGECIRTYARLCCIKVPAKHVTRCDCATNDAVFDFVCTGSAL